MPRQSTELRLIALKLLVLIFLGVAVAAPQSLSPRKTIPEIAKAANGAVVSIVMADKDGNPIAQGSGFIVSKDGDILTNYHVIAEGASCIVKLPDGAFYAVDGVLASDKARDLAVIKAHGDNFNTVTLGDSDQVQVGQEVVAIGNPLSLESTVSNGIVSSIRTIKEKDGRYLQITAPISPGSSGGPLFNMAGQVIGVTTMYLKGGENLNFAIPINDAKQLLLTRTSNIQNLPNETEQSETDAADAGSPPPALSSPPADSPVATPPAPSARPEEVPNIAREYFQGLYRAGGFSNGDVDHVCFSDDPASDKFFTFGALAYDKRSAGSSNLTMPGYINPLSNNDLKALRKKDQKFFENGGQVLWQYVYQKGVKVNQFYYRWKGNSWISSIYHYTWTNSTIATRDLLIEPTTMRYEESAKIETKYGPNKVQNLGTRYGVCEKLPANK